SSAGFTVDQVAALAATLVDAGIEARIAGTSLRNAFVIIQTQAAEVAAQMGTTEAAFRAAFGADPHAALLSYLDALAAMPPQLRVIRIEEGFGRENLLAVQTLATQTERLAPYRRRPRRRTPRGRASRGSTTPPSTRSVRSGSG